MFKYIFKDYFHMFSFYNFKILFFIQDKTNFYSYFKFINNNCNIFNIVLGIDVYNNWINIFKEINYFNYIYVIYRKNLLIYNIYYIEIKIL